MLVTSWDSTGQCIRTLTMRFLFLAMQVQRSSTPDAKQPLLPAQCQLSLQPRQPLPCVSPAVPHSPRHQLWPGQTTRTTVSERTAMILDIVLAAQMCDGEAAVQRYLPAV